MSTPKPVAFTPDVDYIYRLRESGAMMSVSQHLNMKYHTNKRVSHCYHQ